MKETSDFIRTLKIIQLKYVTDLLNKYGMTDCKPLLTHLQANLKPTRNNNVSSRY